MEKDLLNKNVEVLVAFARGRNAGSIAPVLFLGTFLDYDENYYKINTTNSKICFENPGIVLKGSKNKGNDVGILYLRKEFVIYIREV